MTRWYLLRYDFHGTSGVQGCTRSCPCPFERPRSRFVWFQIGVDAWSIAGFCQKGTILKDFEHFLKPCTPNIPKLHFESISNRHIFVSGCSKDPKFQPALLRLSCSVETLIFRLKFNNWTNKA